MDDSDVLHIGAAAGRFSDPRGMPPVGVGEDDRGFSASVVRIAVAVGRIAVAVVGRCVTDVHPRPSIPAPARAVITCRGETYPKTYTGSDWPSPTPSPPPAPATPSQPTTAPATPSDRATGPASATEAPHIGGSKATTGEAAAKTAADVGSPEATATAPATEAATAKATAAKAATHAALSG